MKIALVQLTSSLDYRENLTKIRSMMAQACKENAEVVFLPECFYSMSDGTKATPYLIDAAKREKDPHYQNIRSLALEFGVYLIGGSAATLYKDQVVNRAYNFDPKGADLGHYDKMHLFSCHINDKNIINESDIYTPGRSARIIEVMGVKIGLGICFDLRYSEMALDYYLQGCDLLTYASAFTVPTGRAHWHILNRARAIENQCFVVSAGQWGEHNHRIRTFGHSLAIDPWGEVILDAKEGEKVLSTEINLNQLAEIRSRVFLKRNLV